jgi:hypothetical protein
VATPKGDVDAPQNSFPANRVLVVEARKSFEPGIRTGVTEIDHEYGMPAAIGASSGPVHVERVECLRRV